MAVVRWLVVGSVAVFDPRFTTDDSQLLTEVVVMERTDNDYVETDAIDDVSALRRNLTRYDFVLGVIPLVLLSGTLAGAVMPVSQELLVGVAAILCLPVLFDALYRNPPVPTDRGSRDADSSQPGGNDRMPPQDVDGRAQP